MLHILVRHCHLNNDKDRPGWFNKEDVFQNLLHTLDKECSLTVMFDGDPTGHFVMKYDVDIVRFQGGSDAASFTKCLQHAANQTARWAPSDIIYFLEDDILHKPNWPTILIEGFDNPHAHLVSLYDHSDKYIAPLMPCTVTHTKSCHWRSAISTVNTFALRYQTLLDDMEVYKEFANPTVSRVCVDHERFLKLKQVKGRQLFTCIPAWSTHCERDYLSPIVAWP